MDVGRRARTTMPDPRDRSFWTPLPRVTDAHGVYTAAYTPWYWSAQMPAAVTAVHSCAEDGPYLVGCADGSVRRLGQSGSVTWEAAHEGMSVSSLDASEDARVTVAVVTPSSTPAGPGLPAVRVLDGSGLPVWRVLGSEPGWPIEGRVSRNGDRVLILRVAERHAPALVSMRDSSTGSVLWERRTRHAALMVADASPDLRSVVVGYEIRRSDNESPEGLVESCRDGIVISTMNLGAPAYPRFLGAGGLALAESEGDVSCHAWMDAAIGAERWRAPGKGLGTMIAVSDTLVVCRMRYEASASGVTNITMMSMFDESGTLLVKKEFRGTVPFYPTLSRDGRLLAMIPRNPRYEEPPLLIRLRDPNRSIPMLVGITAIDFEAGHRRALAGMSNGTVGVMRLPD
jgi:hypothetical protein